MARRAHRDGSVAIGWTPSFLLIFALAASGWGPRSAVAARTHEAPIVQRQVHFGAPAGVAIGPDGNVYVADAQNARIDRLSPAGVLLAQWGRWGTERGQLESPSSLALDPEGDVYVLDVGKWTILKYSPSGKFLAEWGGPVWRPVRSSLLFLAQPGQIAVDGQGGLYVADTGNNRIVKIETSGKLLTQWAMKGSAPGAFRAPAGVAVDGQGSIYVADTYNFRIQKLSAAGQPLAQWRLTTMPGDIAVDGHGTVYAVDLAYYHILKIAPDGRVIARWGTYGAGPKGFVRPMGVAVDRQGSVYTADAGNDRVVKRSPTGQILAIWK